MWALGSDKGKCWKRYCREGLTMLEMHRLKAVLWVRIQCYERYIKEAILKIYQGEKVNLLGSRRKGCGRRWEKILSERSYVGNQSTEGTVKGKNSDMNAE